MCMLFCYTYLAEKHEMLERIIHKELALVDYASMILSIMGASENYASIVGGHTDGQNIAISCFTL